MTPARDSDQGGAGLAVRMLVAAIGVYQRTLSYAIGPACRFHPSCSRYTVTALLRHGLLRGLWLGITRLLRCHPFSPGGLDEVPEKRPIAARKSAPPPALHERTSHG